MENKIYVNSVKDTKLYGIVKAAIIGRVKVWCKFNKNEKKNFKDGFYWSGFMSSNEFADQIGLPQSTIDRNLRELVNSGILVKGNYNRMKYDKTGWYRVNYDLYGKPLNQNEEGVTHIEEGVTQNEDTIPVNPPVNPPVNQKTVNILGPTQNGVSLATYFKNK